MNILVVAIFLTTVGQTLAGNLLLNLESVDESMFSE